MGEAEVYGESKFSSKWKNTSSMLSIHVHSLIHPQILPGGNINTIKQPLHLFTARNNNKTFWFQPQANWGSLEFKNNRSHKSRFTWIAVFHSLLFKIIL